MAHFAMVVKQTSVLAGIGADLLLLSAGNFVKLAMVGAPLVLVLVGGYWSAWSVVGGRWSGRMKARSC